MHRFENCPACGAELKEHTDSDEENYKAWTFECGGELIEDEYGFLMCEEDCGRSTPLLTKCREMNAAVRR